MNAMSKTKEKELERDDGIPFCWGVKKGCINFYECFTLKGIEYSLYDTVYLSNACLDEPSIGKLVKILETENHEKKVEVVWFFHPSEIEHYVGLGDVRLLDREIFLTCGEGEVLSEAVQLEAICGKCNVVCLSKDRRNPQPTEEELRRADNIFLRSFDVKTRKISEEFPSSIAGIEVGHFFNRKSAVSSVSEPKEYLVNRSEVVPVRATQNDQSTQVEKSIFNVPGTSSHGHVNNFKKKPPTAGGNMKRSAQFLPVRPSDIGPTKKIKIILSSGNRRDDTLHKTPTKSSSEEKHVEDSYRESKDLSTRKSLHAQTSQSDGKGSISKRYLRPGVGHEYSEVTRRPGMESSKWLKLDDWSEGRLNEANERGTLVVLENLDPSFSSSEVEDIIWHVFRANVKAKMVPYFAFSSPHSGLAIVIFKTKDAADTAILKLTSGYLVLGDGRLIVGRRKLPRKVGDAGKFTGHLTIDRSRHHRQHEEIRNAVSTSHFAQANTMEFDMAIHWVALQEKSDRWFAALHENQGKEIEVLSKQMKFHCPE